MYSSARGFVFNKEIWFCPILLFFISFSIHLVIFPPHKKKKRMKEKFSLPFCVFLVFYLLLWFCLFVRGFIVIVVEEVCVCFSLSVFFLRGLPQRKLESDLTKPVENNSEQSSSNITGDLFSFHAQNQNQL